MPFLKYFVSLQRARIQFSIYQFQMFYSPYHAISNKRRSYFSSILLLKSLFLDIV